MAETIDVEVVYALPGCQPLVSLRLPPGSSALQAVERSGLIERCGLDPENLRLGVFGRRCRPDARLADGDRVEIYRPLIIDPKQRRRRLARVQAGRARPTDP